jgi:hypothetical protein
VLHQHQRGCRQTFSSWVSKASPLADSSRTQTSSPTSRAPLGYQPVAREPSTRTQPRRNRGIASAALATLTAHADFAASRSSDEMRGRSPPACWRRSGLSGYRCAAIAGLIGRHLSGCRRRDLDVAFVVCRSAGSNPVTEGFEDLVIGYGDHPGRQERHRSLGSRRTKSLPAADLGISTVPVVSRYPPELEGRRISVPTSRLTTGPHRFHSWAIAGPVPGRQRYQGSGTSSRSARLSRKGYRTVWTSFGRALPYYGVSRGLW